MGAYNAVRIDFVNGQSQFRFYETPVGYKEYMYGEKSKIESDSIDRQLEAHIRTPFGYGDIKDLPPSYTPLELALRQERSVISSINRTKNMIYSYARGNVWEWFITLTFNGEKVDRYDYNQCSKKLRQWLNNIRKKYALELKYLVIPEQHTGMNSSCKCGSCGEVYVNRLKECPICKSKDKLYAWHFHGLFSNCGKMKFDKAFNKHTGELLLTKNNLQIYNFGNYKLGYSTATPIEDTAKASSYITKYITKELAINTKGFRRYYPSANLDLPPKTYFYIVDDEKKEFLKSVKDKMTFSKDVKVKCGCYEQLVKYLEIKNND